MIRVLARLCTLYLNDPLRVSITVVASIGAVVMALTVPWVLKEVLGQPLRFRSTLAEAPTATAAEATLEPSAEQVRPAVQEDRATGDAVEHVVGRRSTRVR